MFILFISEMALVRIFTTIVLIVHPQISSAQQISSGTSSLGVQQTAQNNIGLSSPNINQNVDPGNFNIQMQQNPKQAPNPQQNLNMQQLSTIPMQTFNVQQPQANFQQHPNSQIVSFQPITQPSNIQQQVPQPINLQQDIPQPLHMQQVLLQSSNPQQATIVQPTNFQQSANVNAAQKSVNLQQSMPIQQLSLQQQSNPCNLQHSQVQSVNLQPQISPHPLNLQQPLFVQPVNLQQQAVPNVANVQQQATPQSVYLQQSSVVQPLNTYQQPVQIHDAVSISPINQQQSYTVQQTHNLQPTTSQPLNLQQQQQIPCNNHGGYQVISYQTPCQQKDLSQQLPIPLQISKVSTGSHPTVIAAIPAAVPSTNTVKQTGDNLYLVSSQHYPTYTPVVITEHSQPITSGPMVVPIAAISSFVPSLTNNFMANNQNQHVESGENWLSPLKLPDLEALNILQGQSPISSLLSQPTSSIQSLLLSSILSSVQNPSASSQTVVPSNYLSQIFSNPQSSSVGSKLSLKSLLPLLLNLLQEKYTNCGCRHCCNCECSQNDNNFHEPQVTVNPNELEFKEIENAPIKNEESPGVKDDTSHTKDHKEVPQDLNIIPDDSVEIEAENSSCEDDEQDEIIDSGEENS